MNDGENYTKDIGKHKKIFLSRNYETIFRYAEKRFSYNEITISLLRKTI